MPTFTHRPRHQLFRPRPSTERHHPAAPALRVRAAQVGGNAAAEARPTAPEGIGMAHHCEGDCRYEQTLRQMRSFATVIGARGAMRGNGVMGQLRDGYEHFFTTV